MLHHLAVWMIEENKSKEATSVNDSLSVTNPENLPSTSAENTSQGPLYENFAKNAGPVYQNLEEVKHSKGDNLSFRAEVTLDKGVTTSSVDFLGNVRKLQRHFMLSNLIIYPQIMTVSISITMITYFLPETPSQGPRCKSNDHVNI